MAIQRLMNISLVSNYGRGRQRDAHIRIWRILPWCTSPNATGKLDCFVMGRVSAYSWTSRGSNPGRAKSFLNSTNNPDQFWGLPTFPFEWYWGISHGKSPGNDVEHSLPYSAEVKMSGAIPLLPLYASTVWTGSTSPILFYQIKHEFILK